jgi:hypothetical protein
MGWVVSIMPWPCFTPRERTPGTHWIGGWVGLRAGLDVGARREILCPCQESNSDRPARSQTLYCLSYHGSRWLGSVGLISYRQVGWQVIQLWVISCRWLLSADLTSGFPMLLPSRSEASSTMGPNIWVFCPLPLFCLMTKAESSFWNVTIL